MPTENILQSQRGEMTTDQSGDSQQQAIPLEDLDMKSINSDDNLMSMEKFEFMDGDSVPNSWSSSINQGNHFQNPKPN